MIRIETPPLPVWHRERRKLRRAIFASDPNWAPFPRFVEARILGERANPFWRDHRLHPFVGRVNDIVGAVAALLVPKDPASRGALWFGFFDSIPDRALASALLDAMARVAAHAGAETLLGPANPTLYFEPGVQVSGFRTTATPGLAATPPYYAELIEAAGLRKQKDLVGLVVPTHMPCPDVLRYAMRLGERRGFRVCQADLAQRDALIDQLAALHSATFTNNWMEPRLSRDDVAFLWSIFRDGLDKRLVLLAHDDQDRLVGLALAVPNRARMMRQLARARSPLGTLAALSHFGEVDSARLALFGIHPDYRFDAATGALLGAIWGPMQATGARFCEVSWVLEDNHNLLAMLASMGASEERRWRIFGRSLDASAL